MSTPEAITIAIGAWNEDTKTVTLTFEDEDRERLCVAEFDKSDAMCVIGQLVRKFGLGPEDIIHAVNVEVDREGNEVATALV